MSHRRRRIRHSTVWCRVGIRPLMPQISRVVSRVPPPAHQVACGLVDGVRAAAGCLPKEVNTPDSPGSPHSAPPVEEQLWLWERAMMRQVPDGQGIRHKRGFVPLIHRRSTTTRSKAHMKNQVFSGHEKRERDRCWLAWHRPQCAAAARDLVMV